MTSREVIFKGRVQGVGFRCTARDIARDLGVTGSVKNCPDGAVRLVASGEEAQVEELIRRLLAQFTVHEKLESLVPAGYRYEDFEIEY